MMILNTIALATGLLFGHGNYSGLSIAEVKIESPNQLEALRCAGARSLACFDSSGITPMLFDESVVRFAIKNKIEFKVIETNIDKRLDEFEREREESRKRGIGGWYSDYKTWDEVNARLQSISLSAPEITTTFIVGSTHEGRDIHGIRITAPGDTTGRKQVLFNGCQHAREWIAVMVPVYVAENIVNGWFNDPAIQSYLESTEVIVVPIVNPDGYEFTYASGGDRFWRKNRRNNSGFCEGVDLNRNWDYQWNGGDSTSNDTCSDVYVGPAAFSEPETQAMRDLINTLPNLVSHIDFHNYSQLILEPWASSNTPPPRVNIVKALSSQMSDAILSVHGETYVAGTGGDLLYLADGVFPDWTTNAGSLSYTIELRPTGSPGFDLPPSEIVPTCEESFAAALTMLSFVNKPLSFSFPTGIPQFVDQGEIATFPMVIESIFEDGVDINSPALHVRYGNSGAFASRPIIHGGGNDYQVELPSSECGLVSEFWFTANTTSGQEVRYPEGEEVVTAGVASDIYSWNMDSSPNWTTQGQWNWGTPTGGGGQYGNPDPTSGATGSNVVGYNLNGDYENNMSEKHLTTEVLDMSGQTNVVLQFMRYLNVEQPSYDHATISVRAGTGDWTTVWTNPSTIDDSQWELVVYDISDIADNQQSVQVRWTMGTTDSWWRYSGWNVDDVQFLSSTQDGVLGDVNCDGLVNVTDILAIVSQWGQCQGVCYEDIVPDGSIDVTDLLQVIGNW
ncbi:MAG: M14 family zinc carboxypeptidase [Phycisphaerales bacterium]|nr:M14 family zinc carboxypeptidase [Phycisphaerales bacterium]